MRELKFRAWDGKNMLAPQDLTQSSEYWTWLGKHDVTLMQFTGLKDKNGTEIYEGDLIRVTLVGKTKDGKDFTLMSVPVQYFPDDMSLSISSYFKHPDNEVIEVIGNIYENPELATPNSRGTKDGE